MRLAKLSAYSIAGVTVLALVFPPAIAGEIKGLHGKASATGAAGQRQLAQGSRVEQGDLVRVNSDGAAQIQFDGATRMVAGPGSSMKIDKLNLKGGAAGKKLEIEALDGVFRFISDETGDKNFAIRTPSATLALRGTAFDFTVTRGNATKLLLLDGEVTMCGTGEGAECRTVATPCAMLRTDDGRTVEQVGSAAGAKPGDDTSNSTGSLGADEIGFEQEIRENFPYQKSQSDLLEEFRIAGQPCSRASGGGLAEFAVDKGAIRIPPKLAGAAAGVIGAVLCAAFCGDSGGGPTSTNKTN